MPPMITISSNVDAVRLRVRAEQARMEPAMRALVRSAAGEIRDIAVESLRERTPRGSRDPGIPLVETTVGTVSLRGSNQFQSQAAVMVTQTKMVSIGGRPYPLIDLVSEGHEAPTMPILPVHKQALSWPGLPHPVGSSPGGRAAPNPYVEEARLEAEPMIAGVMDELGSVFFDAFRGG